MWYSLWRARSCALAPQLCVSIYVDVYGPKILGFKWYTVLNMNLACFRFGNDDRWLLLGRGSGSDPTPPTAGNVTARQISATKLKVGCAGFLDEETEIILFNVEVGSSDGETNWHLEWSNGNRDEWLGELHNPPPSGALVHVCASAENAAHGVTRACAPPFIWDATPPQLYDMWLWHGRYNDYVQPSCRSLDGVNAGSRKNCHGLGFDVYSNSSDHMLFEILIGDAPHIADTAIAELKYAFLPAPVSGPPPDDGTFREVGHVKELEETQGYSEAELRLDESGGGRSSNRLRVNANELELIHRTRYWVHIWACDGFANCEMHVGYPFYVDLTPPDFGSAHVIPDVSQPHTPCWMFPDAIQPAWNLPPAMDGGWPKWDPVPDPESGPTYSLWEVFRMESGLPISHLGPYIASWYSEGHVTGLTNLTLGAKYRVKVVAHNQAGSQSTLWSDPIIADWTPPICNPVALAPYSALREDAVVPPTNDGTPLGGFYFVGEQANGLQALVHSGTCSDPETGSTRATISLGTLSGEDDLLAPFEVDLLALSGTMAPSLDFASIFARGGIDPDLIYYLNVRCTNGAGAVTNCVPTEFRLDVTPPTCYPEIAVLGEGDSPWAQRWTSKLRVGFQHALVDVHSAIAYTEYVLEEAPPVQIVAAAAAGSHMCGGGGGGGTTTPSCWSQRRATEAEAPGGAYNRSVLSGIYPKGPPPPPLVVRKLALKHGHYYRVLATATNRVGITATTPCPTPWVVIDTTPPQTGLVSIVQWEDDAATSIADPAPARYVWNTNVLYMALRGFGDPESGLAASYVSVVFSNNGFPLIYNALVQFGSTVSFPVELYHSQEIYVDFRCYNHAGLETRYRTTPVTVDATPPEIKYVRDIDVLRAPAESMATEYDLQFAVTDVESGIADTSWCLGTFPGACDVSPQLSVDYRAGVASARLTRLVDGVRYYPSVFAVNGAGNQASRVGDGFVVDGSPPLCGKVFDGADLDRKWVGTRELEVSWSPIVDLGSGVAELSVAVVHAADADEKATFTSVATDATFQPTSLRLPLPFLADGERYRTVVRATDRLGLVSFCESDGFTVDLTPPTLRPLSSSSVAAVSSLLPSPQKISHLVHATWEAAGFDDPESGLREYQLAIGTLADPTRFKPFRSIGLSTTAILSGLTLPQGSSLLTLRAVNNADLRTEASMWLHVDSLPPECGPIQLNGQSFGAVAVRDVHQLNVSWRCADAAGEVVRASYAIGTTPGASDVVGWRDAAAIDAIQLSTIDSGTNSSLLAGPRRYYVAIEVTDEVGFSESYASGSFIIDQTPPYFATSPRLYSNLTRRTTSVWSQVSSMHAVWDLRDRDSHISAVYAAVTASAQPPASVSQMTRLPSGSTYGASWPLAQQLLSSSNTGGGGGGGGAHRYYLHVWALDAVGLAARAWPIAFTVDTTPPTCAPPIDQVFGEPVTGLQPAFFRMQGAFGASWNCSSEGGGAVVSTEWMAYKAAGTDSGGGLQPQPLLSAALTSAGPRGVASIANLAVPGARYLSCVRATNAYGLWGARACSQGAVFDPTPPSIGRIVDGDAAGERRFVNPAGPNGVCAKWAGVADSISGIAHMELRLLGPLYNADSGSATAVFTVRLNSTAAGNGGGMGVGNMGGSGEYCLNATQTAILEPGRTYETQLVVTSRAKGQASLTASGFTVDVTPPTNGSADALMRLPERVDTQPRFPNSVDGLALAVRVNGFDDPESDVAAYNVRVCNASLAGGCASPVSSHSFSSSGHAESVTTTANGEGSGGGTAGGGMVLLTTPALGTFENGDRLVVEVTAVNRAGLLSAAATSPVLTLRFEELVTGDVRLADGEWGPVLTRYTTDGDNFAVGVSAASNPMANADANASAVPFVLTWNIVPAPCSDPSPSIWWHGGPLESEAPPEAVASLNALLVAKAFDASLEEGGSYCAVVQTCTGSGSGTSASAGVAAAGTTRCKNATSAMITYDTSRPLVTLAPLVRDDDGDGDAPAPTTTLTFAVACADLQSGIASATLSVHSFEDGISALLVDGLRIDFGANPNTSAAVSGAVGDASLPFVPDSITATAAELRGLVNRSGFRGEVTVPQQALVAVAASSEGRGRPPAQGAALQATLRCVNGAGLSTSSSSAASVVRFDTAPPAQGVLSFSAPLLRSSFSSDITTIDDGRAGDGHGGGESVWYGPITPVVQFSVDGFVDLGMGLRELHTCIGTHPMGCDVWSHSETDLHGSNLAVHRTHTLLNVLVGTPQHSNASTSGTYFASARAVDGVGLTSRADARVVIDWTPPQIGMLVVPTGAVVAGESMTLSLVGGATDEDDPNPSQAARVFWATMGDSAPSCTFTPDAHTPDDWHAICNLTAVGGGSTFCVVAHAQVWSIHLHGPPLIDPSLPNSPALSRPPVDLLPAAHLLCGGTCAERRGPQLHG